MIKKQFSTLCLAILLGAAPVIFMSNSAVALADTTALEKRAEQAIANSRSEVRSTTNGNANKHVEVITKDERFTAKKLQICNRNQDRFKSRMNHISDRGVKQLDVFKKIADRTKAFYETKGYNVSGYSTLAAEVDVLYSNSAAAISATQNSQTEWSCDDNNPQSAMRLFSDAKKNEIATLKAYKDKVRELILLVKQAGGSQ